MRDEFFGNGSIEEGFNAEGSRKIQDPLLANDVRSGL
jgi:hypothetical protein